MVLVWFVRDRGVVRVGVGWWVCCGGWSSRQRHLRPSRLREGSTATTAVAAAPVVVAVVAVVAGVVVVVAMMKTWGWPVVLAGVSLRVYVS